MWIYYRFAIGAAVMLAILLVFVFQYRLVSLLARREAHAGHEEGCDADMEDSGLARKRR
jgi:hypothetical protein